MVLEQSNDENNERGVDEREIQHSIGNFEMSQLYRLCLKVHCWKIRQAPPRKYIELAGDKKCDINANFLQLEPAELKVYDKTVNSRESEKPAMKFFILMPKYGRVHSTGEYSGENVNRGNIFGSLFQ